MTVDRENPDNPTGQALRERLVHYGETELGDFNDAVFAALDEAIERRQYGAMRDATRLAAGGIELAFDAGEQEGLAEKAGKVAFAVRMIAGRRLEQAPDSETGGNWDRELIVTLCRGLTVRGRCMIKGEDLRSDGVEQLAVAIQNLREPIPEFVEEENQYWTEHLSTANDRQTELIANCRLVDATLAYGGELPSGGLHPDYGHKDRLELYKPVSAAVSRAYRLMHESDWVETDRSGLLARAELGGLTSNSLWQRVDRLQKATDEAYRKMREVA